MIAMEFVASTAQAATRSGIEQETVLSLAGLTVEDMAERIKQFPLRQYIQLLENIADKIQDDYFGLHHGFTHHLSDFGVLKYILLNSATVGCALNNLTRYFNVWQQATEVALMLEGDTVWLSYKISDACIQTRKQDAEAPMAFGLTIIRTLTRQHWHPKAVWLGCGQNQLVEGSHSTSTEAGQRFEGLMMQPQNTAIMITLMNHSLEKFSGSASSLSP